MSDWRLVCPLSRLPYGRGVTALLDGEPVTVLRSADGEVRALGQGQQPAREHRVRVRHGVVEVSLRPVLTHGWPCCTGEVSEPSVLQRHDRQQHV